MTRYRSDVVQLIFQDLGAQGRSQRWLAKNLGVWEPRLSEYKGGHRPMPDHLIERAAALLGMSPTVLSLFARVSPSVDTTAHAGDAERYANVKR